MIDPDRRVLLGGALAASLTTTLGAGAGVRVEALGDRAAAAITPPPHHPAGESQVPIAPSRVIRLAAGGPTIAAREVGPTKGPVILLLPGWPQTAYAWRHVQPMLADAGYRSLALDLPGMGGSDLLPQGTPYDTGRVADLLSTAVASFGIERFTLVGHDVGAWTAYAWATRHPAGIETLCLMEATLPGVTPDTVFTPKAAPKVFQFFFNAVEELPELLTQGRERTMLEWLFRTKSLVPDAITAADLDHYAQSYARPGRMTAGFDYYRAVPADAEQNKAAPSPAMPVLALGGEGGVGDGLYRVLRAKARQVDGGALSGVGHYIPEEAPRMFTDRLLSFVSSRRSARRNRL